MKKRWGDCYAESFQLMHVFPGSKLVHGKMTNPDFGVVHHAWIEWDGQVIDLNQIEPLTIEQFRKLGNVTDAYEFDLDEARQLFSKTGHSGPWLYVYSQ